MKFILISTCVCLFALSLESYCDAQRTHTHSLLTAIRKKKKQLRISFGIVFHLVRNQQLLCIHGHYKTWNHSVCILSTNENYNVENQPNTCTKWIRLNCVTWSTRPSNEKWNDSNVKWMKYSDGYSIHRLSIYYAWHVDKGLSEN